MPAPAPRIVGQEVPASGRAASGAGDGVLTANTGVLVGVDVGPGVSVGVGVGVEVAVPVGVAVAVGVAVGVPVGVAVGVAVGVEVVRLGGGGVGVVATQSFV